MPFTLEELKRILSINLDPDTLIDKLQISTEDILDRFGDKLLEYRHEFEDFDEEFDGLVEYEREAYEPDPDELENRHAMGIDRIFESETYED